MTYGEAEEKQGVAKLCQVTHWVSVIFTFEFLISSASSAVQLSFLT